jgi:hypothetical protein
LIYGVAGASAPVYKRSGGEAVQPVIRIPAGKMQIYERIMRAINIPEGRQNMLFSLLIEWAETPEGGKWLKERMSPKSEDLWK